MTSLIDLTLEQYEGNATHPVHGRTPLMLPGTVSHGLTAQRGVPNAYDGSPSSAANEYILITGHTGTHVDAPYHVDHKSPLTVEQIPLERTHGTALWLDLSGRAQRAAAIDPDDLARAESATGDLIAAGDIVLIHTGYHDVEPASGDALVEHPYLTRESAEWLRARGIKALGIDLVSPEGHCARDLPVHMNFLRPRSLGLPDSDYILIFENLRNVARIGAPRCRFAGMPIPFRGATGGPVRAVAWVDAR